MNGALLKERIIERLWQVADKHAYVTSATLTGSFIDSPSLEGLSDIDLVLIVDHLNDARFAELVGSFDEALRPELRRDGYDLLVNPTLGPLKFNAKNLAVLHLMLYSHERHVEHVLQSPFTCFDWQLSTAFRKRSLAQTYPVFGLQPRHFQDARRGAKDYLQDFRDRVVSFRELACDEEGYRELRRTKPMSERDRHEFAYHVIRFLMRNLLKLVRKNEATPAGNGRLCEEFFSLFPETSEVTAELFERLASKKKAIEFDTSVPNLDRDLVAFVEAFVAQFRRCFHEQATRHVVFRHAATQANVGERSFVGRTDHSILTECADAGAVVDALRGIETVACFSSPMARCRQSLELIERSTPLPAIETIDALIEIDYGACEGLAISEAQNQYPDLFDAWSRGEDPHFPENGENTAKVVERVRQFVETKWAGARGDTVTCTHNVVLRSLVGEVLGVPSSQWHRLNIPHLAPITFIQTERFGTFVDLSPEVERLIFRDFAHLQDYSCKS